MSRLNVSQAAKAAGISRSSIYAHIKKGRLTATKGEDGRVYIDVAELQRVYSNLKIEGVSGGVQSVQLDASGGVHGVHASGVELETLRVENRLLREQLRKAEEREQEARQEVRDLLDVVKSQTRLLQAPGQDEASGQGVAPGRRGGRRWWWRRR